MVARKKVERVVDCANLALREQLERCGAALRVTNAMLKDAHLLEAALATDGIVASRDEKARGAFRAASEVVSLLRRVVWVNPDRADESAISWLEAGAPPEPSRCLRKQ